MNKNQQKHIVKLSARQKRQLEDIIGKGKHKARDIKRAQVLLKSNQGMKDEDISVSVGLSPRTVERVRQRFTEIGGGINRAVYELPRTGQPAKLDDVKEAKLVAIACSRAPEGRDRWTLELLKQRLIGDKVVNTISLNAIHQHLINRGIKPWREKNVVRAGADR
jgi:transposase